MLRKSTDDIKKSATLVSTSTRQLSTPEATTKDYFSQHSSFGAVENEVVALSDSKRITVQKYNGAILVDIREYYQKPKGTGPWNPGTKGISLTRVQWDAFAPKILDISSAVTEVERTGTEVFVSQISSTRKCTVSIYNGNVLLNIREYYEKNDSMCPGKKGISLNKEATLRFVKCTAAVYDRINSLL